MIASTFVLTSSIALSATLWVLECMFTALAGDSEWLPESASRFADKLGRAKICMLVLAVLALFWNWYFYGQFFPLYDPSHLAWVVRLY